MWYKYSKLVGRMIKMARKLKNWKIESQVAKTGKNNKLNYNDRQGLLPTRHVQPLANISGGVSTGDLKRPEKL